MAGAPHGSSHNYLEKVLEREVTLRSWLRRGKSSSTVVAFVVQLHHLEGIETRTRDRLGTFASSSPRSCSVALVEVSIPPPQPNQALLEWSPPLGDVDLHGGNHRGCCMLQCGDKGHWALKNRRPSTSTFCMEKQGLGPNLVSPSSPQPPSYLPHGLHLCQVPPAKTHPAPSPVGVVHLLSWHPGLGLAVWWDGDAIFPALERRKHLGEGGRRAPHLVSHQGLPITYVLVGTARIAKVCPDTTRCFPRSTQARTCCCLMEVTHWGCLGDKFMVSHQPLAQSHSLGTLLSIIPSSSNPNPCDHLRYSLA